MKHAKNKLATLWILASVTACGPWDGEHLAIQWMSQQNALSRDRTIPAVPELIDTPPANFDAKANNPFDPARLSVKAGGRSVQPGVIFPDVPVSALWVVGFISGVGSEKGAIVKSGAQYRTIRKGDRIGEQVALVKEIEGEGLLLDLGDAGSQWLMRQK